jgi:indole-3-glycerol phosphate synthase
VSNILEKIIANKRIEVERLKSGRNMSSVRMLAEEADPPLDFGCALLSMSDAPIRIIAECKRKSPSRGVLVDNYQPGEIARAYERGGAAAISVLTDEAFFGGTMEDLKIVRENVSIPIIRKDFIIDEYQIYEARYGGADSFLLLSGVLDTAELQYFIEIGRELGMEALVESHNKIQLEQSLKTDSKLIGINNRNLEDFSVDIDNTKNLAALALAKGHGRILICESGIKTREDIETMTKVGFSAFLVGEALVTKRDPEAAVRELLVRAGP